MLSFDNEKKTNEIYSLLSEQKLYSAALFFLGINDTLMQRVGRVLRQYFSKELPPAVILYGLPDCQQEYGSGFVGDNGKKYGLFVNTVGDVVLDKEKFQNVRDAYRDDKRSLSLLDDIVWDARLRSYDPAKAMAPRYHHGGGHSVCDIKKILKIGLKGVADEIRTQKEKSEDAIYVSFCAGLLDTIDGIEQFIRRCAEEYAIMAERSGDPDVARVAAAFGRNIVMNPPDTFYDAFITIVFLMRYLFTEAGRIDQYLYSYYQRDVELGIITKDEAIRLFDGLFRRIDEINRGAAHHIVIGGCDSEHKPCYNELTKIILLVSRKHAQPNISMRVGRQMPVEIWDMVLESLGTGKANPALICEEAYLDELTRTYGVEPADAVEFGLGGCSETLINGMCNVDGTWVAYNLLDVFHETLGSHLLECESYEKFYKSFLQDVRKTTQEMMDQIDARQHMDIYKADPLRTLSHENCLQSGKSFWAGGAKYNFDSANIYGATNTINGLVVIEKLYRGELGVDKKTFLTAMDANFVGYEDLLDQIRKAPKFGNNDRDVNALAGEVVGKLFGMLRGVHCFRGNGYFMPAIIDYVEFDTLGAKMPATADGRREGAPMVDSIGPVAGTDTNGPTSMINSVASIPMNTAIGTCVLNVRFDPACFSTEMNRFKIRKLIETYFKLGGHQLQVNVVDTELLLKAVESPEEHRDIIVRVGGFTDYFICLSDAIQQNIIERTNNSL